MSSQILLCLLSHKCNEQAHSLGVRIANALGEHEIELLIDPLRPGDDCSIRMKTFDFDSLLFLLSPESWQSEWCQLELKTAHRRATPIFTAIVEGDIPQRLKRTLSWKFSSADQNTFGKQISALAQAIHTRVSLSREVQLLSQDNPPDVTLAAAQCIFDSPDRTVVAEFARELAKRYRKVDPNTQFWIAMALGNIGTLEAARLLVRLPQEGHPYALEGIRQALEIVGYKSPLQRKEPIL